VAFRASELRLILGIRAYGTTDLVRVRRDLAGLQKQVDLAQKQQMLSARKAQAVAAQSRTAIQLSEAQAGKQFMLDRMSLGRKWATANAQVNRGLSQRVSNQKKLFDLRTKEI
jgi:hypothetical protein